MSTAVDYEHQTDLGTTLFQKVFLNENFQRELRDLATLFYSGYFRFSRWKDQRRGLIFWPKPLFPPSLYMKVC